MLSVQDINECRVSRDDLEQWATSPTFDEVVTGCFVRVLLEGDGDRKKYQLAQITAIVVVAGPYTFGNQTTTDKLLQLSFGSFTATYQMNTISNSSILQAEVTAWLDSLDFGSDVEKDSFLQAARQKKQQLLAIRGRTAVAAHVSEMSIDDSAEFIAPGSRDRRLGQTVNRADAANQADEHLQKRRHVDKKDKRIQELEAKLEEMNRQLQAEQELTAKLKATIAKETFPPVSEVEKLPAGDLVTLEARVEEYRAKVRSALSEKKRCCVCLERESQVILYPCRHKATCELCSRVLKKCPLCRALIKDKIQPFD